MWLLGSAAFLFLWRKKRRAADEKKEDALTDRARKEQVPAASGEWLYVGRDDDGTPFYLDTEHLSHDTAHGLRVTMWVKYRPLPDSAAFRKAESFLRNFADSAEAFDHVRQRLEIDFTTSTVSDLELVFCAKNGTRIESVSFDEPEWKKIELGSVYHLLRKTAEGVWDPERFHPDPEVRAKLQSQLREVNQAFEAFETAGK